MKEKDSDSDNEKENDNNEKEKEKEKEKEIEKEKMKEKIKKNKTKKIKKKKDNNKGQEEDKNIKIKVILLGESKVGKTCLINAFLNKEFIQNTLLTLEYSFVKKNIEIDQNNCEIHLWDTAGQERFRSLSKIYIKGAQIIIFVYDVKDKKSFSELPFWVKYVEDYIGNDVVKGVVGNKIDLLFTDNINDDEIVDKQEAKDYANQIGALFQETSAKENPESFCSFVEDLVKQFLGKLKETNEKEDIYKLKQEKKGAKKSKCC